jgi:putative ABC transport system ATP-binding protein
MIRTQNLAFQYPNGPALTFADVDLPQGGVLLLTGPSGCGKSTWLALVAALVAPTSGQLSAAGQSLNGLKGIAADAWRAKAIGFLPQKLHLSAALSVTQNLALAQWAAGISEDRPAIAQALRTLGVAELGARLPAQLSGGQAQRVALARAVLLKPQIILADEPTASLDDEAASDAVQLLLRTAQAQQATLVIATHDARVLAQVSPDTATHQGVQTLKLSRQPSQPEATT